MLYSTNLRPRIHSFYRSIRTLKYVAKKERGWHLKMKRERQNDIEARDR